MSKKNKKETAAEVTETAAVTETAVETKAKKEYKRYTVPLGTDGKPAFRKNTAVEFLYHKYKEIGADAVELEKALQEKVDAKEIKSNNVKARVKRCLAEYVKAGV